MYQNLIQSDKNIIECFFVIFHAFILLMHMHMYLRSPGKLHIQNNSSQQFGIGEGIVIKEVNIQNMYFKN